MSIQSTARARNASRRLTLRSLRLSSACVAVLAAAAGAAGANAQTAQPADASAQAQDQSGTQVKEVVVTGIRRSLQDSVAAKRVSDEVVEVISAEDIGKLPDESIADSLTRLPGLAGQRVGGRYQDIAIRGLAPDFTSTLLNGFQQASTGDNRSAEFDQYPSELINGAAVYKTPDPALVGQGLAGTVDLHTLNPLDYNKRTFAIDVRGSANSLGSLIPGFSSMGDRISGAYIDQFFGGKVGVSLGVAHLDSPEMERWYQTWYYGVNPGMPAADANAQASQGADIYAYARRVVRDGAMATLEFKPTSNFHSINNLFVSKFRQTEVMRGLNIIEAGNADGNQTTTNPVFKTIGGQLFNTGGTINEIQPLFQSYYNTRNDDELSFISRNTWDVGGWRVGGDASYSYAQRKEQQYQEYAQYGATGTNDSVTFANTATTDGFPQWTPSGNLNYADASKIYLDCPSPWGGCWGHDGLLHAPTTTDTIIEGRLSAKHDMPDWAGHFFKDVQFGADYSDRTKDKTESDFNLDLPGAAVDSGNNLTGSGTSLTMQLPSAVVSGSPVDLGWAGFGKIFGYDPQKLIRYYTSLPIANEGQYSNNWNIEERLATLFLKLDIGTELFNVPVTGNVGFQYVYATQDASGFITQPQANGMAALRPYAHSESYGEFLPNLNLRFALPHNQVVRFAVSREMSRPRLDQLVVNASAGVSLPTDHTQNPALPCSPTPANASTCYGNWSGNGGNPDLKPWLATSYDLTYEKYFTKDKASYIAVQYYYKDLATYIYNQTVNFNFAGYPNLNAYPVDPNAPSSGPYTRPANGQGGHIEGLEIAGTLGGKLISPWLDGFGVTGSFARAWTTILQNGPKTFPDGSANPQYDPTVPLEGLSGTVTSWTAFYEKYGFSARISERFRSAYYADVGGLFASINRVEIAPDESYDAQLSYDVPWGPFKGLTLLVQGYNITNSPYRQYAGTTPNGNPTNLKYYQDYGRTILFGFNYKF